MIKLQVNDKQTNNKQVQIAFLSNNILAKEVMLVSMLLYILPPGYITLPHRFNLDFAPVSV